MSADGPNDEWTDEVIEFLSSNIRKLDDNSGWDHVFISAYQMGCMALIGLGQAYEEDARVYRIENPQIPKTLPRWDDVCFAVLVVARQNGLINYRYKDRSSAAAHVQLKNFQVQIKNRLPEPYPNLQPKYGLGYAFARDELLSVLSALGLIEKDQWAARAETVLWRISPKEWTLDFETNPRFQNAINHAVEQMPDRIRDEIENMINITDEDVDAATVRMENEIKVLREKYGPQLRAPNSIDAKKVRRSLEFQRSNNLDWIFYRNWRLDTGWLSEAEAARALDIFHDPLAQAMKREVIALLYPNAASR
ncbi:MAG: hypothetical protein ABJK39_06500 [Hyphomicrobiales bacterium]